jgi:hypothetical protein
LGIQFAVVLKAEEEIGGHCDEKERLDGCVCVFRSALSTNHEANYSTVEFSTVSLVPTFVVL